MTHPFNILPAISRADISTGEAISSKEGIGPIGLLVLQPTTFCNLDCSYCYLPNRNSQNEMSVETAIAAFHWVFQSGLAGPRLEARWHAGEPLVKPLRFYQEVLTAIKKIPMADTALTHSIQSNGTLLTSEWCDFIKQEQIRFGISLDGPQMFHDTFRQTRGRRGTFKQVMRGVELLQRTETPFEVIAVVTSKTLDHPDEFYQFFAGLGIQQLGLNLEETEGIHVSDTLKNPQLVDQFTAFMRRLRHLQKEASFLKIREFDQIKGTILFGNTQARSMPATPLGIVSVDYAGNLSTFSPELLGMRHPQFPSFVFGQVSEPVECLLSSPMFRLVAQSVASGVEKCRRQCEYYSLCGGGAPANKLWENGSFDSVETLYCRTRVKVMADLILSEFESSAQSVPPEPLK